MTIDKMGATGDGPFYHMSSTGFGLMRIDTIEVSEGSR